MKKWIVCFAFAVFAVCGSLALSACNKPKELHITFNDGYDTTTQSTIKEGELVSAPETPVRSGYEFAGWYENEKLEKEFDFSKPVYANTTIYADWVSNEVQDLFSWVEVEGGIKLATILGGADAILPKNLIVPRVIDGQKVVELEEELFQGQCYPEPQFELTSVKIPYGVTKIGDYAFKDCYNIEDISIPETVTSMGVGVFKMSSSSGMCLKNITLPSALTTVPNETFYHCSVMESVHIPSGVTSIGDYAFYGCNVLDTMLPDTIESIGMFAFQNCWALHTTKLPASLKTIGDGAFDSNYQIRYLDILDTVQEIGVSAFGNCHGAIVRTTHVERPTAWAETWDRNVTAIYDSANNDANENGTYFIANDCKYLIHTPDEGLPYLSLEFCFLSGEKVVIETKATYKNVEYALGEVGRRAFSNMANTKKLIFNESLNGAKLTFTATSMTRLLSSLEYIVLPKATQPLDATFTYALTRKNIVVYTSVENVSDWQYRTGAAPLTVYAAGTWSYVDGEPTPNATGQE